MLVAHRTRAEGELGGRFYVARHGGFDQATTVESALAEDLRLGLNLPEKVNLPWDVQSPPHTYVSLGSQLPLSMARQPEASTLEQLASSDGRQLAPGGVERLGPGPPGAFNRP